MTANRASLLGLFGLVLFFCAAAASCSLDTSSYGSETETVCSEPSHCDDGLPCTEDSCEADGVCKHVAVTDAAPRPDGVQGNCAVSQCVEGALVAVEDPLDVDDGNPCTEDSCDGSSATHTIVGGAPCQSQGGMSTCNAAGECEAPECGHTGADGEEVGCGPNPSDCTIAYCDKGKGKCKTEKLDGVPVPGSEAADECGGQYCLAGAVLDKTAPLGSPCALFGGDPGMCDPRGECVECIAKADCDDGIPESKCHSFDCVAGQCQVTFQQTLPQTAGDCRLEICTAEGLYENQEDNADIPVDGDLCTQDLCTAGTPSNPPAPLNTACGAGLLLVCDGMGNCKGCNTDDQCLGGTDCKTPFCDVPNDQCSFTYAPQGTTVTMQTAGDCTKVVCDGNGNMANQYEPTDPENDANDCTTDVCTAIDATSHTAVPKGTTCGTGGGEVCDAVMHCVGAPCPANACPMGTTCVDGVCCESMCGGTCNACSTAKKGAGPNGLCGPIMTGDPEGMDCPGNSGCNAGTCQPLAQGAACVGAPGECLTGFCTDGVCCGSACGATCQACNLAGNVGTCSPVPNLADPANECASGACNGAGACKLDNGQTCANGSACLSGNCVDGVCCNTACGATCQACNVAGNVGTCSPVPNLADPANECPNGACNGGGQCKSDNGQGCGSGGDCLSGNCPAADGVCCNTACGNTCQACTAAKTGGANGTCANVATGTDPDNECFLTTSCGGGACVKLVNGSACTNAAECTSNQCVDGVCCNAACGGTCQACNLAATMGTCTSIADGADPGNECANGACNGAGACELDNGQTCTTSAQCLSNICVDNRCCNNTCSGTCQSCGLAGSPGVCTSIPNGQDPGNECSGVTTCNGAGQCTKLALGAACAANVECASNFCVDGACCSVGTCGGACKSCDPTETVGGVAGACDSIAANTDPDNECSAECNGAGACEAALGATCTVNSQCASGFCADGVCCNAACNGSCESCSAAGVCTDYAANTDPENECAGAQVCGLMGTCVDGPNGQACLVSGNDPNCASGFCSDGVCCGTACTGNCEACNLASPGTCQFIPANTDPANECSGAQVCNGSNGCVDGPNGQTCPVNGNDPNCASGFCVDGYCCETACSGNCEACNVSGFGGQCKFIPAGTDPDNDCPGMQVCDGSNMCM